MYARFGQELYARETLIAAALVARRAPGRSPLHYVARSHDAGATLPAFAEDDLPSLTRCVAESLPQESPHTRRRIATKLLQRMAAGNALPGSANQVNDDQDAIPCGLPTFACLLSDLPDTQARRDLIYYGAARADGLIAAIARHILYPYFIENRIPEPYGEDEFIMANAGLLLAPEPILTTGFVCDFACRAWGFESERTVTLALRILRQAGILLSAPILASRGRVAAWQLAPHGLSLPALLWAMYAEWGQADIAPAWDQVTRSEFAQMFVVHPSVVASRIWEAEKAGMVALFSGGGSRRVVLKVREQDALARLLLSGPESK